MLSKFLLIVSFSIFRPIKPGARRMKTFSSALPPMARSTGYLRDCGWCTEEHSQFRFCCLYEASLTVPDLRHAFFIQTPVELIY